MTMRTAVILTTGDRRPTTDKGPLVKRSKTPPFHGGNTGSNPVGVTINGRLAQLGERLPYKQDVGGSNPSSPTKQAKSSVEEYFGAVCFLAGKSSFVKG